ncbi:hypothetical protein Q4Q39_10235 [Flavivirga amylovorans]|uniref:DUF4836 family protein n=1 Tax=Flavivirga amylovorans TaxID=870486 RepID=A0ABT8X1P3_9FLAO|nr:hypothetical protein [Flavivirga amylovorans]MDO5987777.1 hypothetical protein [Flavivirga amylovorans]
MKKNLLLAAVFISFVSIAQNIESKIPSSSEAVISINGDRIIELISITEFDNFNFAKKIFKKVNRKTDSTFIVSSIKDLGFDINSKAFYFYTRTDSISYHNFLVKLTDKNKFESLLSTRDKEKIISEGGLHIMADNSSITVWNDNLLLFTGYEKHYNYFKENEERFMAEPENEGVSYYKVKKKITSRWTKAHALNIFKGHGGTSISNSKNYIASKDKNAVASVWVQNYSQLIFGAMSGIYNKMGVSSLDALKSASNLYGVKSITANLYFDEEATRLTTQMEVSSEWQKTFKSFYNSKMNKNFYNYFNQNDILAYMSFSMNTQALLEEYPALMTSMYGGIMPNYKEEVNLSGEFLSLLLDEEAIGELMTGDMLFVLNDFGEKEVTYTTYEYDENYKSKEVTKTKKEVVPDFMIMIGSKKEALLNKVVRLGIKHKLIANKEGYYKINVPKKDMPFDLYVVVKNDILFFTSSEEKISNIVNNRYVKNLGKHQKLIKNNSSVFYINGEKLISKVPVSELSRKERRYFDYAKDNLKDAYFKSSKMKGNKIQSEIKINTSNSHGNSLNVFFNLIEALAK